MGVDFKAFAWVGYDPESENPLDALSAAEQRRLIFAGNYRIGPMLVYCLPLICPFLSFRGA